MLGDAVHPMLPYLAQGANSAIEDAVVLGECLRAVQKREDLPKVLQAFQEVRMPRSKQVVEWTHLQRHWNHMEDGKEQEERDALIIKQHQTTRDEKFPSGELKLCRHVIHMTDMSLNSLDQSINLELYGHDSFVSVSFPDCVSLDLCGYDPWQAAADGLRKVDLSSP